MEEQIKQLLEEDSGEIKRMVNKALQESLAQALSYSIRDNVYEVVQKFVTEEITPALLVDLQQAKPEIIAAMHEHIVKSAAAFGEALQKKITENLSGYRFGKVIKEMTS